MIRSRTILVALMILFACGEKIRHGKEIALIHDLAEMRKAIRDYRQDKGRPPATLDELVRARYLRVIPNDPLTGKPDWRVVVEQPVRVDEFSTRAQPVREGGVVDVRSNAPGTDSNGKAWSEY